MPEQLTLDERWRVALQPADTREIWEWFHDEGELPTEYAVPGKLDIDTCPMIKEPLRALKNPLVRDVTAMASIQSLKTLAGEIWLTWLIENDPGPTQWLLQDDEEAKEHSKERFLKLLEKFPAVHRRFADARFDKTAAFLKFLHMFIRIEGALNRGNTQRKSIKNQMRSEVWQSDKWIPGRLKEADSRLTQFVHNSKTYTESQPGWDAEYGVDDMHGHYLKGTQEELNFRCEGCRKLQPFLWDYIRADGSRAAMRWDDTERTRRESGEWRWSELIQTVRYECIHCGHRHYDEPITRRRITGSLEFVALRPDIVTHRSFTWNQMAMPTLSWFETKIGGVKNFLLAHEQAKKGFDKPLIDFWMKVPAVPYDPKKHAAIGTMETIELSSDALEPRDGKKAVPVIEYDGIQFRHRLGAVDVQEDYFRVVVEAWSDRGDSLTLDMATDYTWDDVAARMERWGVPEIDVCVDISHRGNEVKLYCCRNGYWARKPGGPARWRCWKALRGSDQDKFTWTRRKPTATGVKTERIELAYTWPPEIGDPTIGLQSDDPRRKEMKGKRCEIYTWSNPTIKDIVIARRDGKTKGVKCLVTRGEWNKTFNLEMHSQKKVFADGRWGGGKWKWEKFRPDHSLDCRCMITVRAMMKGLLGMEQAGGVEPKEGKAGEN